ncbi:Glutamate receptor 2.9-like, partial [Homarus americanus]
PLTHHHSLPPPLTHHHTLTDVYSSAVGRANRFERRGDQCKFYLGKVPVKVDLDVFAFAKNSPILYQFNQAILGLLQHGVIQHIKRKYYSVACEAEVTSRGPQPMNLIQVQGALYVLLVGLSLALLSLITELLWHRRRSMVNTPHNGQHYN